MVGRWDVAMTMQDAKVVTEAEEARGHDTWHVKAGCWKVWKTREEGKELLLIYLQVILAERISKQHLLLHVGNWRIHSESTDRILLRVFVGLTSEIMLI